jgi:DNA-binding protein HU-beta
MHAKARNPPGQPFFGRESLRHRHFRHFTREKSPIFRPSPRKNPEFPRTSDGQTRPESHIRQAFWGFSQHPSHEEVSHMAKAAAGKQTTVTMRNLAAKLAEDHEMSKKQTEAVLGDLVDLVTKHLKKGDRIRIGGLGILQVRKRAARMGRNPATGEPIQIKASKKVAFRAAKELKEAV